MGRTITPMYTVRVAASDHYITPMAWPTKQAGRPTEENLAAFVAKYNESFAPGGVNYLKGERPVHIHSAQIVRTATGKTVVSYTTTAN